MAATKKCFNGMLLIAMTITLLSFDIPAGWFKAGSDPKNYDMGIDKGAGQDGGNAASIKSITETNGFGTLMQNCMPDNYLGKRVRLSGMVKTRDVVNWSGLWFRIDQKGNEASLGFDNMHDGKKDRSIRGTTDWTKYEIVLDVPLNASNLAYGALLVGTGQIWFDKMKFEIVNSAVATTGGQFENVVTGKEPVNLDFEN